MIAQNHRSGIANFRTILVLAAAFGLPAAAFAADNSTFERTLSVNGTVTLRVDTRSGYIRIYPSSDSQVHIIGHVKPGNSWFGGDSAGAMSKIVAGPPIEQAGNIIRVGSTEGDSFLRNVNIDYDIKTPANTILTAHTGSGDVELADITGTVKVVTGSGNIRANRLGSGSRLETGSGTIGATDLAGEAVLQTGSGGIHAQFAAAGDVTAGTGSGSIQLINVQGGLKVETGSGNLDITGQPTSPWKLETGSGNITLAIGNSHFTLQAETGSGSIKSDLPLTMQGSMDKHHVTGTVNGGGPTLKVETGSGDIRIH
jgi:Putative adhesin